MSEVFDQYDQIVRKAAECAAASGRAPGSVRVLAVSKTFPASDIEELYAHGVRAFGESRVAELEAKAAVLPPDIEWHFIGRLQSNKLRKAIRLAAVIHSVDSAALIEKIDRIAGEENRPVRFLLEVNCSGEPNKGGTPLTEAEPLAEAALRCEHARCAGLMTMAREGADAEELRRTFGALKCVFDRLRPKFGAAFDTLSMGMSGDYPAAIACGATVVRIGTAIFGRRSYPTRNETQPATGVKEEK